MNAHNAIISYLSDAFVPLDVMMTAIFSYKMICNDFFS